MLRFLVRMKGVEPPRLAALDPKSSVSTSSTTSANGCANIFFFYASKNYLKTFLQKSLFQATILFQSAIFV